MNNFNIVSYVLADYNINNTFVDVCFTSGVVEAFFTKKHLMALEEKRLGSDIFDELFDIIKARLKSLNTYEVWYDLIEYKGIELVWKSKFVEERKTMYVEVLYSRGNHPEEETTH